MPDLPPFRLPAGADVRDPIVVADVTIGYADAVATAYRNQKDIRDLCAEQVEANARAYAEWVAQRSGPSSDRH